MSRPPRDALRREILAVSQRLFTTVGFRGTSLQMIADEVECSKASLLYHFKSKPAILDALIEGLGDDLEQMITSLEEIPESDRLTRTLELSVALVVRHRAALAMLRGLEDIAEVSAVATQSQQWADRARAILAGPDATPLQHAAALTLEHGLLGACLELPGLTDEELASCLLQVGARILGVDPTVLTPATT
ncbi:MAG TPA: TetR/AcrR family transcriptional regulator [Marmoricola sp.]|nr:TetR/AcrR family transcriptional regulator [Marmoricola sp.]